MLDALARGTASRVSPTTNRTLMVVPLLIHDQYTNDMLTANYHSLCLMLSWGNTISAAVSPGMGLRFDVTTKAGLREKKRHSDAGDEAWTARQLRASLAMCGYSSSCYLHHARRQPRRRTIYSVTTSALYASRSFMTTTRGDTTTFCALPGGGVASSSCSSRLRAAASWMRRESENRASPSGVKRSYIRRRGNLG